MKQMVSVERMADNEVVVYKNREGNYVSRIKSKSLIDPFTNINNFDIILVNKHQGKTGDTKKELLVETIQFS